LITAAGVFLLPTTVGLISAYLIATIIPAFFTCLRCIRQIPKNARKDQKLPRYGVFLSLLSVLPWISGNIGSIILASLVGPEALAIYAVASRFLTAVQKNFTVFYKPVTAKLASQSQYEHWQTIRLHGFKLLCIGFLLAFALWVTTPVLIQFFFTRQYDEAVYFGQLLSLALIPLPFAWVLSDMIIYEKRKKPQVFISVVPPLTKIFLYFILIPRFGLLGLVLITLLERYTDPLVPFISLVLAHKKG
jgi:O-antigen/teichoic acid export membrane protein